MSYTKTSFYNVITILFLLVISSKSVQSQISKIDKLEQLLEMTRDDSIKVVTLNDLYDEYRHLDLLTAKSHAEKALKIAKRASLTKGTIRSLENLARALSKEGIPKKSIELYSEALALEIKINDAIGQASTYNNLGNVYLKVNMIAEAITSYKRALALRTNTNDKKGTSIILTNLGSLYYRQKNFIEAYNYFVRAKALAKQVNDFKLENYVALQISKSLLKQRRYQQALLGFKEVLETAQKNAFQVHIHQAYQGLSRAYAELKNYEKAYEYQQLFTTARFDYINAKKNREVYKAESDKRQSQTQLLLEKQKEALERKKKKQEIRFRNYLVIVFASGFAVILIMSLFLFSSFRKGKRNNKLLKIRADEIERKSREVEKAKNELDKKNSELHEKNLKLEDTHDELARYNKDITASINYAQRIQESMLPLEELISTKLSEYFILFKPRDIVSGDFYWFADLGDKCIISAADCTGHGVPGAIMSMLGNAYLTQIVELKKITSPDDILYELHANIGTALQQDITNNQDGMDIAICVIDKTNKKLEYSGASSPFTYVKNDEVYQLQAGKLPIGGFQKDRERIFEKHIIDIDQPLIFYMHSDGYQDQFGGPKGRKFAKKRLKNLLFDVHKLEMQEQKKRLDENLLEWRGQNRQMDDVIVIGVRLDPASM